MIACVGQNHLGINRIWNGKNGLAEISITIDEKNDIHYISVDRMAAI